MKYTYIDNTSLNVSKLCLGTMTFGEQTSLKESFSIMDYVYDQGINFLDTAEIYPIRPKKNTFGKSEEIIGKWLKINNNREKIILATKVASCNYSGIGYSKLEWIRNGGPNLKYDKDNLNEAVNGSLKRLGTDYIDLYQLHWPERSEVVFGELDNSKNLREAYGENVINSYLKLKKQELDTFYKVENFDKKKSVTEWEKSNSLDC